MAYIAEAARIAAAAGLRLARLNVGGGLPARRMRADRPDRDAIFAAIAEATADAFGTAPPALVCEPGRAMVADAVTLAVPVTAVRDGGDVILADGLYGGLSEFRGMGTSDRIEVVRLDGVPRDGPVGPRRVWGPTCDSLDRLPGDLVAPADLSPGDIVLFHGMGACASATATRFNGFGGSAARDRGPRTVPASSLCRPQRGAATACPGGWLSAAWAHWTPGSPPLSCVMTNPLRPGGGDDEIRNQPVGTTARGSASADRAWPLRRRHRAPRRAGRRSSCARPWPMPRSPSWTCPTRRARRWRAPCAHRQDDAPRAWGRDLATGSAGSRTATARSARRAKRPSLAEGRVRFVGEPVALVVADTLAQARDAAEMIEVDLRRSDRGQDRCRARRRTPCMTRRPATSPSTSPWATPATEVAADQAAAARTVSLEVEDNRIIANSMEPRGAFAEWDGGACTCFNGQGVWGPRAHGAHAFNLDPSRCA